MKLNPIFRRDEMINARSLTLPLLITVLNGGLGILSLINLFYVVYTAEHTGEIAYQGFLRIYYIAGLLELFLLLLLAPALAVSSVASERGPRLMGLLLTTQLRAREIIVGKLMGVMSTLLLLMATSLPIFATAYIYGGITPLQILLYIVTAFALELSASGIGLLAASCIETTAIAMLVSYAGITACVSGCGAALYLRERLRLGFFQTYTAVLLLLFLLSAVFLELSIRRIRPRPEHPTEKKEMPRGRRRSARLFLLFSLLWMCFIFSMSQENSDQSSKTSMEVGRIVAEAVVPEYRSWTPEHQWSFAQSIDHPVRKCAHATEYMILGILYSMTVLLWSRKPLSEKTLRRLLRSALPLAALYASSDEFHQLFVSGRGASVKDVCIDSAGAFLGVLLVSLCVHLKQRLKRKAE